MNTLPGYAGRRVHAAPFRTRFICHRCHIIARSRRVRAIIARVAAYFDISYVVCIILRERR